MMGAYFVTAPNYCSTSAIQICPNSVTPSGFGQPFDGRGFVALEEPCSASTALKPKQPRGRRPASPGAKLRMSVEAGKRDEKKSCVLVRGLTAPCSACSVRDLLKTAGFSGTYEEISLPSRFMCELSIGFAANFCDVQRARLAAAVLSKEGNFTNVTRTNKFVLQLSAANMDSESESPSSQTTGASSSSSFKRSSCSDAGSDHGSGQASCLDIVGAGTPVQQLKRARSASRLEDDKASSSGFELPDSRRLVGDDWQHSRAQPWSAQVSVRRTFIDAAELTWQS